jgi:hypothetical protein
MWGRPAVAKYTVSLRELLEGEASAARLRERPRFAHGAAHRQQSPHGDLSSMVEIVVEPPSNCRFFRAQEH